MFKNKGVAFLLLFPQLLVSFLFFLWPAYQAIIQSFYQSTPFGLSKVFVGLKNFFALFASNTYLTSFFITLVFCFFVTFCTLFLGLFIFNPSIGWVSTLYQSLGLDWNYLIHPKQAFSMVVLVSCWQQFSYNFLFFLAGLQSIPKSLLEAASIDGANNRQQFWQIIFPLLSPTTFFLFVINLIYAFFDTFGVIQVLTQGGPARTTSTLVYKVYIDGFIGLDYGESAAQSVILMVIISFLMLFQFYYVEKKVHY